MNHKMTKVFMVRQSWLTETMRAQDACRIMIEQTEIKEWMYGDYQN